MMNAKLLPTYQQFKVKKNKPLSKIKRKNAEAVLWKKKSNLKEISEANVMHLADSHPHLALLEPVSLFLIIIQ